MTEKMDIALKKCVTPPFRLSYPALDKPKAFQDQAAKYSLVALFPKETDLAPIKTIIRNAIVEKFGPDKTKWPKKWRNPLRDGDEDKADVSGYENMFFCSFSATQDKQPGIVDQRLQPVLNIAKDLYAGCWCRAQVIAYWYDVAGNKGVGFSLQNVQKLKDDKPFSGRQNPEDVFDEVEDSSDDADGYDDDDAADF